MASETQDIARALGQIEGRLDEQSARLSEHTARFDRFDARLDQLHSDVGVLRTDTTAGFQQVNYRIDRLMLAILAFGGGIIAILIGLLVTLFARA